MKKTVLLVEDKKNVRESLFHVLEAKGFNVEQAESGEEALKKLEKIKPDLIISDTSMPPGMNGYEFCRQVKQVRKLDIKLIMYTATFEIIDPLMAKKRGADDFIVKGSDPEVLFKAVDRIINNETN